MKNNSNLGINCNIENLNVNIINNNQITSNLINCNQINSNNLYLNNQPLSIIPLYLYCNVKIGQNVFFTGIPILKSGLASYFSIQNNGIFYITILPNYRIRFFDILNNVLFDYENINSNSNIVYFYSANINGIIYKINLYYNNILI